MSEKFEAGRTANNRHIWVTVRQWITIDNKPVQIQATTRLNKKEVAEQIDWLKGLSGYLKDPVLRAARRTRAPGRRKPGAGSR
jgi:hypothetical protein